MAKLTRGWLINRIENPMDFNNSEEAIEAFKIALAGMDSDKNSRIAEALESLMWPNMAIGNKVIIKAAIDALRAAPPAPVAVPDEITWEDAPCESLDYAYGWNAYRAAMLKGESKC